MRNYTYNGSSTLAFTFQDKDHIAFGKGPHILPEDAPTVQTLVKRGILKEVELPTKRNLKSKTQIK